MPPFKSVCSLQSSSLKTVAYLVRRLCYDCTVTIQDLRPILIHLKYHLPPQIQALVCHTLLQDSHKIVFPELLNQKYLMICTELNADYIWINNKCGVLPLISGLDGQSVHTLKMTGSHSQILDTESDKNDLYQQFLMFEPLYEFMCTLTNLTTLKCSQLCNNNMLKIFSKKCPLLEDVQIEMCTDVDDEGVFHLAGHLPTADTYSMIRRGVRVQSESVCKKLKRVNLEYTLACSASAVMLLYFCPEIEDLNISPDVSIGDVFNTLHGSNQEDDTEVTVQYSLKVIRAHMEVNETDLSLIVRTCPKLEDVTLRCNGVERKDRNFLANLLCLNIKSLNVMNCNTLALLWYLNQQGKNITNLTIQHLTMAPISLTFTRTHLQQVIQSCPNLSNFTLKLNNRTIDPDVPYSSFGSRLHRFHSLSHLMVEGANITTEDLSVLVSQCTLLQELHILIHNLDILEDQVLYDLLASGCLKNVCTLFLYRPMLTLAALKRILVECPYLHTVGPLSSWAISKSDRMALRQEIRKKNWDLNIEGPEMMHLMIL
ncbi:hypothetical protein Pcinc_027721 [Petrolisthes cinctipes]|uniref:Uncharacterized protein n=1 Tax=Petrolisthes cinctipes TaxID=88211 RepID=A0AAE1F4L7_PETCI|nr:hypothetical protein Pcinc_027721 [Petrolisthes cinctipes]